MSFEQVHIQLMREVLNKIQEKPLVLKGGTALMLCYGLDRFSEDLDLDIKESYSGNGTINLINTLKGIQHSDFQIQNVAVKKDTPTVTRYMVDYLNKVDNERSKLKIEISYRTPAPENNVHFINGVNVLDVGEITKFKIGSVIDKEQDSRTKARDLYDAAFIAKKYPETLSDEHLNQLADLNIEYLQSRYQKSFTDDPLLYKKDLDLIILNLHEDISNELAKRKDLELEQEKQTMNGLNEYYYDAREVLNEPTTSLAQREYKQQLELDITETRIYRLERDPIQGNYDLDHLAKIHKAIFEHLYDWAGEVRMDDISKRAIAPDGNYEIGHFLYKEQIFDEFDKFSSFIEENDHLKNLGKDAFVDKFTQLYAQINEIHPFEEGNGRATKLMMNQLANEAGYRMDVSAVSVNDWNYACKRSLTDQQKYVGSELELMDKDMSYLRNVMDQVVQPLEVDYRNEKSIDEPNNSKDRDEPGLDF